MKGSRSEFMLVRYQRVSHLVAEGGAEGVGEEEERKLLPTRKEVGEEEEGGKGRGKSRGRGKEGNVVTMTEAGMQEDAPSAFHST